MAENTLKVEIPSGATDFCDLVCAVDRAKPSAADVVALRKAFVDDPDLLLFMGNLARMTAYNLIQQPLFPLAIRIAIEEQCNNMRAGLGWDKSSILEKMLIDQIILSWLRLYDVEMKYHATMSHEHTLTLGIFWEKRLSAAQKRYLSAVESLAKVRKLLRPDKSPVMAMLLNQQFGT